MLFCEKEDSFFSNLGFLAAGSLLVALAVWAFLSFGPIVGFAVLTLNAIQEH